MTNLAAELERLNNEIAELTTVRDYLAKRLNGSQPKRGPGRPRTRPEAVRGRITAAQAASEVLAEHGQMRTPDLLKAVQAKGARIASSDNLYKTLSRSDKFRKVGRGVWALA